VIGMEGDVIITQDLFVYDITGEDANGKLIGRHRSTGIGRPKFLGSRALLRRGEAPRRGARRFLDEFPNAVDVIVRGVKAGLPLLDCLA
jgi:hypothetical protein